MIDTGVLQLSILAILLGGNVYAYLRFQVDMKAARAAIDAYDTIKIERRSAKSSLSILEPDSRPSRRGGASTEITSMEAIGFTSAKDVPGDR